MFTSRALGASLVCFISLQYYSSESLAQTQTSSPNPVSNSVDKLPEQSGTGTIKPPLIAATTPGRLRFAPGGDFSERISHAFDGTSALTRYVLHEGAPPTFDLNKGIYILDLRLQYSLTNSGKYAVRARLGTGSTATDDTNSLYSPIPPHFKETLNLREIYVDLFPAPKFEYQVGALPVLSPEVNRNALSDSAIGWVDGGRVIYAPQTRLESLSATVGRLGVETDTNSIHRFIHEDPAPNFMQIHLRLRVVRPEAFTIQQSEIGSQALTRFTSETTLKNLHHIIDGLVIEEMIGTGGVKQKAFAIGLRKNFKKLELLPYYIARGAAITPTRDTPFIPLDTNFYAGGQFALLANRYVGIHNRFQMRLYKFQGPEVTSSSNHGWIADFSYKYTWAKTGR